MSLTLQQNHSKAYSASIKHTVPPEDVLYVLLLEPSLHDELVTAIDSPAGSQLSKQEREQMFWSSVQHFRDLSEVGKRSFLCSNPYHLNVIF